MDLANIEKRLRSLEATDASLSDQIADLQRRQSAVRSAAELTRAELAEERREIQSLGRVNRLEVVTVSELNGRVERGRFRRLPKFLEENQDYSGQRRVSGSPHGCLARRVVANGGLPC